MAGPPPSEESGQLVLPSMKTAKLSESIRGDIVIFEGIEIKYKRGIKAENGRYPAVSG